MHANELYETTTNIQTQDTKFIIETTFKCLTKIDDNRAIRNLMSFEEITDMLGKDKYSVEQVAEVLRAFRMPGNTFIRPFISGQAENGNSAPETVLDITGHGKNTKAYRPIASSGLRWTNG